MDVRLPTHLEVSGLVRQVNAAGGFAMVLVKGEPDAGTILLVLTERGADARVYERMPQLDGTRSWSCSRRQESGDPGDIQTYVDRRREQDPDLWIVELDVADGERFIGVEG